MHALQLGVSFLAKLLPLPRGEFLLLWGEQLPVRLSLFTNWTRLLLLWGLRLSRMGVQLWPISTFSLHLYRV